jgi:hypothetical protein
MSTNTTGVSSSVTRWDGHCHICKRFTRQRFTQINHTVEGGIILAEFWCISCLVKEATKK